MHIKSSEKLIFHPKGSKHSWSITPQMGVVKHFPRHACKGLIALGAIEVTPKKTAKAGKAKPAK